MIDGDVITIHCTCGLVVIRMEYKDEFKVVYDNELKMCESVGYKILVNYPYELEIINEPCGVIPCSLQKSDKTRHGMIKLWK